MGGFNNSSQFNDDNMGDLEMAGSSDIGYPSIDDQKDLDFDNGADNEASSVAITPIAAGNTTETEKKDKKKKKKKKDKDGKKKKKKKNKKSHRVAAASNLPTLPENTTGLSTNLGDNNDGLGLELDANDE